MSDVVLTLKQAAERLGVSPATLKKQAQRGRLVAIRPGHDYLVTPDEVERYRRMYQGRHGPPKRER